MSIFKKAAEKGQVSNRTPFLSGKGIYKCRIKAVRSGESEVSGLNYTALDVELLDAKLAEKDDEFVAGQTRTIMNMEPKDRTHQKIFFDTMITHAYGLAVALWAQSPDREEDKKPGVEDITGDLLEAFFGSESMLVGREVQVEVSPRTTKKGAVVWNYAFQPLTF